MWWHLWYLHSVKNHLFSFYVKLYGGYRFLKLILTFHVLLCTYVSFGRKMVHAVIFRICTLFATWHINKVGSKTELHFLSLPGQKQRPWKEIHFYPSWRKYTWCFFVASISQSTANISFYTLDGHSMSVCSTLSFLLGRPSELIMSTCYFVFCICHHYHGTGHNWTPIIYFSYWLFSNHLPIASHLGTMKILYIPPCSPRLAPFPACNWGTLFAWSVRIWYLSVCFFFFSELDNQLGDLVHEISGKFSICQINFLGSGVQFQKCDNIGSLLPSQSSLNHWCPGS